MKIFYRIASYIDISFRITVVLVLSTIHTIMPKKGRIDNNIKLTKIQSNI